MWRETNHQSAWPSSRNGCCVKACINKAWHAFASLILTSRKILQKTKLHVRLFNLNGKSVLLYGSECLKTSQKFAKNVRYLFINASELSCVNYPLNWIPSQLNCLQGNGIGVAIYCKSWGKGNIKKEAMFWTPNGKWK